MQIFVLYTIISKGIYCKKLPRAVNYEQFFSAHFWRKGVVHEHVGNIFTAVAPFYDKLNDILSWGMQRWWKGDFISHLPWDSLPPQFTYIDMACGTGDIGFQVVHSARAQGFKIHAFFCDANPAMLQEGKSLWHRRHSPSSGHSSLFQRDRHEGFCVTWARMDAESTPFPANFAHLYTVAFGMRNVSHRKKALEEAHRILRPGGIFACVEFCPPQDGGWGPWVQLYLRHMVPWLGAHFSPSGGAYEYLSRSIFHFPRPQLFEEEIRQAGFQQVCHHILPVSCVARYGGVK